MLEKSGNGSIWNYGSGNLLIKMEIITDFNQIDLNSLEEFIYNHPHGNFFQSTNAFKFFQSVDNYEPILLVAKEKDEIVGSLLAVVMKEKGLKGYFSRRCIVWGGPLVKDDHPEIVNALLQKLNENVLNKAIYTEFRNLFDMSAIKEVFKENKFVFLDHLNFIIEIVNLDENFKNLNENRKRQIKKAIKNNVEISIPKDKNEVKEFFVILKKLYKEKVNKPLPNFNFFEKFFFSNNLGKYFLVKSNGNIIGGIMCPIFKDTIYE